MKHSTFTTLAAAALLLAGGWFSATPARADGPKPRIVTVAKGAAKSPLQSAVMASGASGHAVAWTTGSLRKGYRLHLAYISTAGKPGRALTVANAKRALSPAIGATPSGYVLAWAEGPAEDAVVKAVLVKHGGKPAKRVTLATGLAYPSTPVVAAGPASAMVGWISAPDAKSRVYGAVLPLAGGKPTATIEISEGGPPGAHWPALAWNGSFFMPSWYDDVAKNVWVRYIGPDGAPATDAISIKGGQHVRSMHVTVVGVPFVLWEHQAKDGCWDVFPGALPSDPKKIEMDFLEGVVFAKAAERYALPAGMRDALGLSDERLAYLKFGDRCATEDEMLGKKTPAVELRLVSPGKGDGTTTVLHRWKKATPAEGSLSWFGGSLSVVWYDYPTVSLRVAIFAVE